MLLLDVNILIALADADHVHHSRATDFFLEHHSSGWATCPITENGFVRILGNPNYPKGPGSPSDAKPLLVDLCQKEGHVFLPDDISLRDSIRLPGSKHLTDHYLLALAIKHDGRLATIDGRMNPSLVAGGASAYFVIS